MHTTPSMRALYGLLVAILVLACALSLRAATGRYSLRLTAHPQAIAADSHTSTTISAEVRDPNGNAVPDGTMVEFNSSLGIIEPRARTIAGVARVRLQAGTSVGTANVSGVAPDGGAVAELRVDFLEPGTEIFDEAFLSMSSKSYLGYDTEKQMVDSVGGVRIEHRGLIMDAHEAQFDVRSGILRAKGKPGQSMTIKRGGKTISASALVYDINTMRGFLIGPPDEGAVHMTLRGSDLHTEPDANPEKSPSFDYTPVTDSEIFITAKSLVVRPGEDIRFKRATYYMDGESVMRVPLQIVPLRSGGAGTSQMLTYGTDGIRLNLPLYYSLTANTAGAIRVKHGENTGWGNYSDRAGWQVDLDNDYNYAGATQGTFSVNRVTSKDWGLRWNNRMLFENDSQVYTYFDFPGHRDLFGSVDYSRPMRDYTWSVNLRGNKYRSSTGGYYGGTFLQSHAKPLIGDAVNYSFSTRLAYDNRQLGDSKLGSGLGLQLYGKPIEFNRQTSLSTSLSVGRDWGGGDPGLSLYGSAGLSRMLGSKGFMGVNYSYSWTDSVNGFSSQRLSTNVSYQPANRWNTSLFATYGLNDRTVSAFGDVSYLISPTWRFGIVNTYQKFQFGNYSDAELTLSKAVGRQAFTLAYSQSRKKFRVEMNALAF